MIATSIRRYLILSLVFLSIELHAENSNTNTKSDNHISHWFVGGGVAMDFYDGSKSFSNDGNTDGYDIHAGYQPNEFVKIIVGYKKFGVDDFNSDYSSCSGISNFECNQIFDSIQKMNIENYYLKVRPEWIFENNFLIYADFSLNSMNIKAINKSFFGGAFAGESSTTTLNKTETQLSWGIGVGYNIDHHEITLGVEWYDSVNGEIAELIVDSKELSSMTLQYNYQF